MFYSNTSQQVVIFVSSFLSPEQSEARLTEWDAHRGHCQGFLLWQGDTRARTHTKRAEQHKRITFISLLSPYWVSLPLYVFCCIMYGWRVNKKRFGKQGLHDKSLLCSFRCALLVKRNLRRDFQVAPAPRAVGSWDSQGIVEDGRWVLRLIAARTCSGVLRRSRGDKRRIKHSYVVLLWIMTVVKWRYEEVSLQVVIGSVT